MKPLLGILSLLVALGAVYGLAFFGVIPTQKMADQSPALAPVLVRLHLARKKAKPITTIASPTPHSAQTALDAEKKQIESEQAALDKERAAFIAQQAQAAVSAAAAPRPIAPDSAAKLVNIYATMSPDDICRIFTKLPDSDVIAALTQLDEKKAGKVLAALPVDRAARLARLMSHPPSTTMATASAPALPVTNL